VYVPDEKRYRRYDYEGSTYTRRNRRFKCFRPWKRITLDAAGTVIACEFDYRNEYPFGTIDGGESPLEVWKSQASRSFRRTFAFGWNDASFCKACTLKDRVADDCTVARIPLTP
jgi:radical SAM protein with 4Fe4S-binding SPASM domain